MRFVALDLETADTANSRPCSIGLVFSDGVRITDTKYYLINPEVPFNPIAVRINGITPDIVQNAPTLPEVWSEISGFLESNLIVAHNAAFDLRVLEKAANSYSLIMPKIKYVCTMCLAKDIGCQKLKLSDVCSNYGISVQNAHNSLCDATACAELFLKFCSDGLVDPVSIRVSKQNGIQFDLTEFEKECLRVIREIILESGIDFELIRYKKKTTLDITCYYRVLRIGKVRGKYFFAVREKYQDLVCCDLPNDRTKDIIRFYLNCPSDLEQFNKYICRIVEKSKTDWNEYVSMVTKETVRKHVKEYEKKTGSFMAGL